jgi:hypothetical protein
MSRLRRLRRLGAIVACCGCASTALADAPWLEPGDTVLRHDAQLLSDAGLLHGPSLSWPIAWSQVLRELQSIDAAALPPLQAAAHARLQQRAASVLRTDSTTIDVGVSAAAHPPSLRGFADEPREEGEIRAAIGRNGDRFAWRLEGRLVAGPDDDQSFRPDGSFAGIALGNWMLSAGWLDRWWGPGWDGSLILSTNARPIPAIALDRNESLPFDVAVLKWLGPWRVSVFMGQLEEDRDFSHALLFGMRGEIRPWPWLQIGLSRTAQWCGEGRPCDLDTFWDLLAGQDNDQPIAEQPGNQLAGLDLRWSWPAARVPLAIYAQGIGEDEAGLMPSKYLGLFGFETWHAVGGGSLRLHAEYADTACDFVNSEPEFGCAYESIVYTTGYRYRGRAIGHTLDGDGESVTVGASWIDPASRRWELLGRDAKVNRAGASTGNTLADAPARVHELRASHERSYAWGNISLSAGYTDVESDGAHRIEDGFGGYVTWHRRLR